jgi:hypothetical protein
MKFLFIAILALSLFSCHSTRKIQSAITPIDTTQAVIVDKSKIDSAAFIKNVYNAVQKNYIDFKTFSARIKVEYSDTKNGKGPDLNVFVHMRKDSAIWLSINATIFNYEAFRVLVTPDSVKVLNKKDKLITLRSVSYLREVAKIPFDFYTLQDLIIGNPVYLDKNIISYKKNDGGITILSVGEIFKNLLTVDNDSYLVLNSKLDDRDAMGNRTCYIAYSNYDMKNTPPFATMRNISVSEKTKLDVDMDFKQYNFNENVSFPFAIPKNYKLD